MSFLKKLFGPRSLEGKAAELARLVLKVYPWYMAQRHPLEDCPEYERVRRLGEEIHQMGGNAALQKTASLAVAQTELHAPFSASLLNKLWDGIGGWRA
jgi:hypothetical protein